MQLYNQLHILLLVLTLFLCVILKLIFVNITMVGFGICVE